ncbi:zinc-finger domain-containing protein [Viridibacillus arvi]|uniref:zinc-finger domain-containing protein n=1 Tax=Viridibacillus arvi TaxID=263475 RepID=UPI0034CE725E
MAQLTLQEQKELRLEAVTKIDRVCGSCQTIIENRKELGNKAAYNYCVRECPVGKQLQVIGEQLLGARGETEPDEEDENE